MKSILITSLLLLATACTVAAPATPTLAPAATAPIATPIQSSATLPPTVAPTAPPAAAVTTEPTLPPAGMALLPVISGLERPVGVVSDGAAGWIYIIEQPGRILRLLDGSPTAETFLDITDRVGSQGNEQGLLGLAFHPQFASNNFFYVNYTDMAGNTVISRFRAVSPRAADPASEINLLKIDQPFPNHNGGGMAFGPDGFLYLGLGDGGSAGDPQGNAQKTDSLLGKILRLEVKGIVPYTIPADNPFAAGGGRPEIWALGLRNPWRFSFDRLTGDLYIGDVGQNQWEEIDYLPAGSPGGANFGWNYIEGTHPYQGTVPAGLVLTTPIYEYEHTVGCSVTGGVVYRGTALPALQGAYLFGDFCSGIVWSLRADSAGTLQAQSLVQNAGSISSFGEDAAGEVYVTELSGAVYRLVPR